MRKFSNGKEITEDLLASCCRDLSSEITPNIYLGNEIVAKDKKHLLEKGITHIIRIGDKLIDHYKNDFTYLSITIKDVDEEQIYGYFNVAFNFMEECFLNKGKVFVHCRAGISRSASLVCSYFMKKNKIDTKAALEIVEKRRAIVNPNPGFFRQLDEYYIREIKKYIKKPKQYKKRNYTSHNLYKKAKYCNEYSISEPKRRYNYVLDEQINTKIAKNKKLFLEENKIILYLKLEEIYIKYDHLSKSEIRSKLEDLVKYPTKFIKDNFSKGENRTAISRKLRHKKLSNLIVRLRKEMINDVMNKKRPPPGENIPLFNWT